MATDEMGLPSPADIRRMIEDIEVPEFDRKYTKRQGPASVKKSAKGRTFSASGPKADLIAKMIFAELGLTRSQMAKLAGCSPSRVSEVIWALESAVKSGQIDTFPTVPRSAALAESEDEAVEEPADEELAEAGDQVSE